jgi:uncharacterized protein (DUF1015 family)
LAELRPFRGLRYRVAGDIASVLAPPYDVIDAEQQAALHAASAHNVIRLELGEQRPDDTPERNRYTRAAETLAAWRRDGAVALEDAPAYYVYVQEFEHEGRRRRRTALLGRLRLEPWEAGVVRPHEETMRAPKEDRLQLLRHLRANVSPIFALYRDAGARVAQLLPPDGAPALDATMPDGARHTLHSITDGARAAAIASAFESLPLYILDGHHRYETALAYREERRAQAASWTGEEPENFVLAAVTPADDPGLVLLPIHRLVRPPSLPPDLPRRLERFFQVDDATPKSYDGTALLRLLARLSAAGASGTAFGALGLEEGRLHLLTLRDAAAARALMPERSRTWQELDVAVLEHAVLGAALGVRGDAPGMLAYTHDASQAMRDVETARWPLAFLLNPTRVEQMIAVADAGERMPAKSTFFWPKLATGLVINALE